MTDNTDKQASGALRQAMNRSYEIAKLAVLASFTMLASCEKQQPCIETATQTVATYPYLALQSLGPAYAGIALIPVYSEQTVCVRRAAPPKD